MVIFVRNPIARAVLFLLPIIIFAIVYFTVIKPSNDDADKLIKNATQQSQQQIRDAQRQLNSSGQKVPADAQQALDKAAQLTQCVSDAGTDVSKMQECQAKYGG